MTRKQIMRLMTMLLVCIILFNYIAQPKAEAIGGSLALALGGTSAAKAFLAFIMSCIAMGVTYATFNDAKAAYDDYKQNSTMSIDDLLDIQKETWTGNYEGVKNNIINMKDAFVGWLEGLFGTLKTGINEEGKTGEYLPNGWSIRVEPYIAGLNNTAVWYRLWINSMSEPFVRPHAEYPYNYTVSDLSGYSIEYLGVNGGVLEFNLTITYKLNGEIFSKTRWVSLETKSFENLLPEVFGEPISATIATDATILNPAYTPNNRTFPAAPYLPYIDFDNEKITQSISAAGGTMEVYNGSYEQYLDDVVNNATWEDIQGVISGSVPTTTLKETSEGLIIGEVTDGIPYPIPDTTAPSEVLTGLGGIMGLLQGITNWISQVWQLIAGIFAIPEDLALDFSSLRLEGFKNKFPFSIPWDLYNSILIFSAEPIEPELKIDIDTEYLKVNHFIDLSMIQTPLLFARYVMVIFFIIFLILKTRDLIKW